MISDVRIAASTHPAFPLTRPNAPKLSAYVHELLAIEESHWLSNYGPVNARLEAKLVDRLFGGVGECLTVCNATIALMIALKEAAERRGPNGRYVLMPSFTFAAAAHAVLWAGLTPLLVDIDPSDWGASAAAEDDALDRYGDTIAAIMPYAAFGSCIDLGRYDRLASRHGVPVVVDAAASLGSLDADGRNFGASSSHTIIFSMHATKAFGVGEAGLIYSADSGIISTLRRMGNFGFGPDRSATMPGLNSKISEVVALSALIKLSDFEAQIAHRATLAEVYLQELPGFVSQRVCGQRIAYQFMPLLLPSHLASHRDRVRARLSEQGIGAGAYFSPHIHQQPYFRSRCKAGDLSTSDDVAARMLSLPISDFLTADDVVQICGTVRDICRVEEAFRNFAPAEA